MQGRNAAGLARLEQAQYDKSSPLYRHFLTPAQYAERYGASATVLVDLAGTLDLTTGQFSASGPIVAATGKLSGATGSLTLSGVQDLADPAGGFTETVSGSICVDLGGNSSS